MSLWVCGSVTTVLYCTLYVLGGARGRYVEINKSREFGVVAAATDENEGTYHTLIFGNTHTCACVGITTYMQINARLIWTFHSNFVFPFELYSAL